MASEDDYEVHDPEALREPEPTTEKLSYSVDDDNFVPVFEKSKEGQECLRKTAKHVKRLFDADWESCEDYRARQADNFKLFTGMLKAKTFPFKDSANAHVPIAFENLTRLYFRAAAELLGDATNVMGVLPVGPDDRAQALVLSQHGNWQLREEIPDFFRQMHAALLMYFLNGDVVAESFRDTYRDENRHEVLTCDDFVVPYSYVSRMPDFSDCPHYTRVRYMRKHELEQMAGWHEPAVDRACAKARPSWDSDPGTPLADSVADVTGQQKPDDDLAAQYKILHWYGWLRLPPEKGGKDSYEPGEKMRHYWCKVVLHYDTGNIFEFSVHEEASWQDIEEFELKRGQRDQYLVALGQHDQALVEHQAVLAAGPPPPPPIDPMSGMPIGPPPPPFPPPEPAPPVMPTWMDPTDPTLDPPRPPTKPIHMFSHGVCVEPLRGILGFGFGGMVSDMNRAANTALSQFIDAATLNNARGIIASTLVKFKDPFTHRPGAINYVEGVTGEEMKRNIMPLEYGPPSSALMEVVMRLTEWGQSSIHAPDVMSGAEGKSGETFRGLQTRVEQAGKNLSVSTTNFAREFFTQVLKNNARLNAIFMADHQMIAITNDKLGQTNMIEVGRQMYRRNYQVTIQADLKFKSEAQRIAEADQLVIMASQQEMLKQNVAFYQQALKDALQARGRDDLLPYLGPIMKPPQTPLGLMAPPMPNQPGAPSPPKGPSGPSGPAPEGPRANGGPP